MTYPRRTPQAARQRRSQPKKFGAPTAGWISNRSLAYPGSIEGQGAALLDNFFPKASSVTLRRGKQLYATLGDGALDVSALFTYVNGQTQRMFASTVSAIYDVSAVVFPENSEIVTEDGDLIVTEGGDAFGWSSTEGFLVETLGTTTDGNWITVQFATSGGVYLVGVNGLDRGFIYDGETFYPLVNGGIIGLPYDALTTDFVAGETVTGGTSAATGTIERVMVSSATTGTLWLTGVTGSFVDNEAITSASGAATSAAVSSILAPGIEFPGSLTTADMSYVWVYKNRLWFAEKDTMNAYYLDEVDSFGGSASIFPLAGVFGKGGSLLFGAVWSIDGNNGADLSEQNIFVSSEGEVAVYQGINPAEAATWNKVGLYQIGRPLGNRAHFRGGGDIAIATSVGLVPLSKAVSLDITSLAVATVSYKIADAWSEALTLRGMEGWQCQIWPELKQAIVSPPNIIGANQPVLFISNTETGAWTRYTGWQALCMCVFRGQLFFGSPNGQIFIANASGKDHGDTYTGVVMPLFEDMGSPGALKIGQVGRAVVRANTIIQGDISMAVDFDITVPSAPDASVLNSGNLWDLGIWGQSAWSTGIPTVINQEWQSLGGAGYACSVAYQVTSGSVAPLDVDVIQLEMLMQTTELVA